MSVLTARTVGMFRRAVHLARAHVHGGALVLVYHRVARVAADPFRICVSPPRFAEHLAVLKRRANVVPLAQLVATSGRRPTPARMVAVTFDDGYEDNVSAALPALERFDVPATVFVVSGTRGEEFWWDRLSRAPRARLERYLAAAGSDGARTADPVRAVHARLRRLGEEQRRQVLNAIDPDPPATPTARALTDGELARLAASPLIEIGAHTESHPELAALAIPEQRREIGHSRTRLEAVVGGAVTSFAYPFGRFAHFTSRTVALLRDLGFARACTAEPGVVTPGSDPFRIPRVWVDDWDGDQFERRLLRWLR